MREERGERVVCCHSVVQRNTRYSVKSPEGKNKPFFSKVARRLKANCSVGEVHNVQLHHATPIHDNQLAFWGRKPGLV